MAFEHPTYLSLDMPEPVGRVIREMRRDFDPCFADLPVEIAIAGSSGLGVIASGQSVDHVLQELGRLAATMPAAPCRFDAVTRLDELHAHVLAVDGPSCERLGRLQTALRESSIRFDAASIPFRPHCAIRWSPGPMAFEQEGRWKKLRVPASEFLLSRLSIYVLKAGTSMPECLRSFELGGQ